jgi:putative ABC transport system permease protein
VLAAAGAYLLRRRGLPAAGTVDPLLVGVPVLLSAAVALLILRGYPWLLRVAGPPAARARSASAFLGLALARRATTGALVVVVVAVAGAAFCAAAATGIRTGRDRAATLAVPGDMVLTGDRFADDTTPALAALPGVRTVEPVAGHAAETLSGSAEGVYVLVVDGPALTAGLHGAALVSPDVAADLTASRGTVTVDNRELSFRAGSVASSFPLIPPTIRRFVVVPAVAGAPKLTPTGFVITGTPDPRAVERTGIAGRTRYFTTGPAAHRPPDATPVVTTHAAVRAALDDGGANGLLSFGFAAGVLGGLVLALAAVAAAVLADAPGRARIQVRLRTMGLSRGQRNRIVLIELAPAVGLAVLAGAATGVLLPVVVGPALRLSAFTGGVPVGLGADPGLAGGVVVFGLLALVLALAVEAMAARRLDRATGWRED